MPAPRRARSAPRPTATTCCACSPRERGFYVPSFYEPQYAADGTLAGYVADARRRRAAAGAQGRAEDDRRARSAGDQHLHARHRVRIALPRRGRPRLREPVPLLLGRLQLPAGPRVSDRPHPRARRSRARALEPRRPRVDRALRSSGHRAHPRAPARDGLRDQPGVAAARRSDRADRARPARERRARRSPSRRKPARIGCAASSTRR